MAYFLKQTPNGNRTYLSIVNSHYSKTKKGTAHSIYKSLRSVEYWKENGIEDPIAHFQKEVAQTDRLLAYVSENYPQDKQLMSLVRQLEKLEE